MKTEEPVEVRNYSLGEVSSQVSQLGNRADQMVTQLKVQNPDSEDTDTAANSNNAVQEEELGNMLNKLGFRLNDANLLSPGDHKSRNDGRGRLSSPRFGLMAPNGPSSRSQFRNQIANGKWSPIEHLSPSESQPGHRLATA
jgi:hypothetical protein